MKRACLCKPVRLPHTSNTTIKQAGSLTPLMEQFMPLHWLSPALRVALHIFWSKHSQMLPTDLRKIEYSPVAVVMQTFQRSDFTTPPEGFRALQSREEQQSGLLGILFTSHLYPHRCSTNQVMTRSILGGSIIPEIVTTDDTNLQSIALNAHRTLLTVRT